MLKRILRNLKAPDPEPASVTIWDAAGCTFISDTHILAGYQARKKKPFLSGIGGRREKGETVEQTAFREMIEELLELPTFPQQLLRDLETQYTPLAQIQSDSYIELLFTFETLESMLSLIHGYGISSPLYEVFPRTVSQLLFTRNPLPAAELSHLALLPLVRHKENTPFIDKHFLQSLHEAKILSEGTGSE